MVGTMMNIAMATRNAHKAGEIQAMLGTRFRYWTLASFPGAPETAEDAPTFEGNAKKKAVELARWLAKQPLPKAEGKELPWLVLADDSGLEVDALNGAPGVLSARFAAREGVGNSPDAQNNAKLLRLLGAVPLEKRAARFRCVIALAAVSQAPLLPKPFDRLFPLAAESVVLFGGACEGRLAFEPRGHGGFGYDPLFVPDGYSESFAQLGEAVKNRISHRAQALAQIRTRLLESPDCAGLKAGAK
jgi:XTP/dITP diphosphohydrolase